MKYLNLFTLFFLIHFSVSSQEVPRTEFLFRAQTGKVEITRRSTNSVDVQILKSKSFQKSSAKLEVGSTLPKGVSVQYSPEAGVIHESKVVITASEEAQPGEYHILLNCTVQRKTKGVLVKLNVL